jgi:hypothetical protein
MSRYRATKAPLCERAVKPVSSGRLTESKQEDFGDDGIKLKI